MRSPEGKSISTRTTVSAVTKRGRKIETERYSVDLEIKYLP